MARLDPHKKSKEVIAFEESFRRRIVGQDRAIRAVSRAIQRHRVGIHDHKRPIGTFLFMGPTGVGKTEIVRALANALHNDPEKYIRVDCAEFQAEHEISKLIGSPPGYVGEGIKPRLSQENLNACQSQKCKVTIVLFDEIEKASNTVWQLLLGILDNGYLVTGKNEQVSCSNCIIVFTSNLGAKEMISRGIGFTSKKPSPEIGLDKKDQANYETAKKAAEKKFSPEFMNRIDKLIVFRTLTEVHFRAILDLELSKIQMRIIANPKAEFIIAFTQSAKDYLLEEGISYKYGARQLKRALEKYLVAPLSNLIDSKEVSPGDYVEIRSVLNPLTSSKELVFDTGPGSGGADIAGKIAWLKKSLPPPQPVPVPKVTKIIPPKPKPPEPEVPPPPTIVVIPVENIYIVPMAPSTPPSPPSKRS